MFHFPLIPAPAVASLPEGVTKQQFHPNFNAPRQQYKEYKGQKFKGNNKSEFIFVVYIELPAKCEDYRIAFPCQCMWPSCIYSSDIFRRALLSERLLKDFQMAAFEPSPENSEISFDIEKNCDRARSKEILTDICPFLKLARLF